MEKIPTIEFELSGMSGICREYVGNVGKGNIFLGKKYLHLKIFDYLCSVETL